MACDLGLRGLGYRSGQWRCGIVLLGKTLHLHVHSLNPGVNGHLVGQWLLCVYEISTSAVMGAGAVCSLGSWAGTGMNRSHNQGSNCKSNYKAMSPFVHIRIRIRFRIRIRICIRIRIAIHKVCLHLSVKASVKSSGKPPTALPWLVHSWHVSVYTPQLPV